MMDCSFTQLRSARAVLIAPENKEPFSVVRIRDHGGATLSLHFTGPEHAANARACAAAINAECAEVSR